MSGATFSMAEFLAAHRALREQLDAAEESFPLPAFVGMISDEIEQLRDAGHDDAAIAGIVSEATGKTISADDLARFYAAPEERGSDG